MSTTYITKVMPKNMIFVTLTLKVEVQNLIISNLGKEETDLKYWTTLHQNHGLDLEGQCQGQGPKFIIFIQGKDETCLKFWTTLHQNFNFELQGHIKSQGQDG